MSVAPQEFVEIFLQEASEHLQFLREYSGVLQDPYPVPDDIQRLYISAHTLEGSSGLYGFPLFREVAGRLSHIFQYALNAAIAPDAAGPLVEFISEAIAVLESDLLMVSATGGEATEEIEGFKQKYSFAFQAAPAEEQAEMPPAPEITAAPEAQTPGTVVFTASVAEYEPAELAANEEVPAEVLEFFVPEAEEHLQVVQECLLSLESNPNHEDINRLFRAMHTVKGSAAQVGLHRIARVAHRAEDLIGRLRDGELQPTPEITDVCLEAADTLKHLLYGDWEERQLQDNAKALLKRINHLAPEDGNLMSGEEAAAVACTSPESETSAVLTADAVSLGATGLHPEAPAQPDPVPPAARDAAGCSEEAEPEFIVGLRSKEPSSVPQSKSVRIALERLDSMMNAVGELVINRTRMLGRLGELERLADVLNFSKARMSEKIESFQEKYEFGRLTASPGFAGYTPRFGLGPRFGNSLEEGSGDFHSEFSELEMDRYDDFNILSRSLTEISADITEVFTQLDGFVRKIDQDIDEFTKLAHRLQDEITQARMVPVGNLYTRISRTVRDAAKAAGKQVELVLSGAETELDNNIIQQISDPLIHLVRNCVAHGLESAEERRQAGKEAHGTVNVRAYHRGNHIFIEVEDDGAGIDFEKVRSRAVENGMLAAEEAGQMGERQLLDLLFEPGFSTADRKTELAGRGVGLDVVKANLAALNGEIDTDTQRGGGTRFTLKVPLTLIISQALFVRCGTHTFALPLALVEEIRRLNVNELEEVGGKLLTKVRDVVTEVIRLDSQLGLESVQPVNGSYRMVIVNVAGRQVGVVVEEVLRKDEIVIKNLGEYMRNLKMFPGATIAPDGSLILLIDVNRLVSADSADNRPHISGAARIFAPGAAAVASGEIPEAAIDPIARERVVVLVDDSISVRKFVGRMLEKAGYRVRLAGDGLDALEIVSQSGCDLVITDLEMPRTNGYELMAHLRQDPHTRNIPVMVVTSRAGAKHRDRAMKEGAAAFMTKPVQEEQFVEAVRKLIGGAAPSPVAHAAAVQAQSAGIGN